MKNELVILRDHYRKPRLARVWRDLGDVIEVGSEASIASWEIGDTSITPIAFRRGDVFRYDKALLCDEDWGRAIPIG